MVTNIFNNDLIYKSKAESTPTFNFSNALEAMQVVQSDLFTMRTSHSASNDDGILIDVLIKDFWMFTGTI